MWKVHTLVVALAGTALVLGLFGADLIGGSAIDRLLTEGDLAVQSALSYPTLGALGFGVLLAYALYGLWLLNRYYDLTRRLVRLTELWAEGVAIRTDGYALATDFQVSAWVERRYTGWHNRVVDTLEPVAPMDARIFATTPEAPVPESGGTFRSAFHRINLLAMSQELDKLKEIIDRHQANLSPVIVSLVMQLLRLQGESLGHVPRARALEGPERPE